MWGSMVAFQNRNRYTYIYSSSARSPCERAMTSSEARRQIEIHGSAQAASYKSTGPHRRPLSISEPKLQRTSCSCRCHCRCRCRCLVYQYTLKPFHIAWIGLVLLFMYEGMKVRQHAMRISRGHASFHIAGACLP